VINGAGMTAHPIRSLSLKIRTLRVMRGRSFMLRFKLSGAAVVVSVLVASPVSAQPHMVDEPGMFAFYKPMGDLGIASTPRPPASASAMASMRMMQPMVTRPAKSRRK
jgi:hypothetical protein